MRKPEPSDFYGGSPVTEYERRGEVWRDSEYERRTRAKAGKRHRHIWVRWDAWESWTWNPLRGTRMFVCDVPGCIYARIERVA